MEPGLGNGRGQMGTAGFWHVDFFLKVADVYRRWRTVILLLFYALTASHFWFLEGGETSLTRSRARGGGERGAEASPDSHGRPTAAEMRAGVKWCIIRPRARRPQDSKKLR